jgi:hypothetical protein
MTIDRTKSLVIKTALAEMLKKGHFDVCTIRNIGEMTGIVPDRDAMTQLTLLHCMDYSRMPAELRKELPNIIHRALCGIDLDVEAIVNLRPSAPALELLEEEPKPWYKRLTG